MGDLDFNVDEQEPISMDYDPIPKGIYDLVVSDASVHPTSNGNGLRVAVVIDVLDPDYAKRKIFENFNIRNPSEKAQRIGKGMLTALCKAIGKAGLVDESAELIGIPFKGKVGIVPADGQYSAKNNVTAYFPANKKFSQQEVETEAIDEKTTVAAEAPKAKKKSVNEPKPRPQETSLEDDDIPF